MTSTRQTQIALLAALIAVASSVPAAQARMAYYTSTYMVRAHFDSSFYGVKVNSVMAHVGVVSGNRWPVTADIELQSRGDGFFGKTQFTYKYDSATGYPNGVSIAYLVRLADGRQIWTNTAWVPVLKSGQYYEGCSEHNSDCLFPGAGQELFDDFNSCSSADQTYATKFTTYN